MSEAPWSRTDRSAGHLIITGTGRAGTTLLVQILSHLGFDTGYAPADSLRRVDPVSHAGLEPRMDAMADWPYVVKKPLLSVQLGRMLAAGRLRVRGVIVPVRTLSDAAESRRRVTEAGRERGALWLLREGQTQEHALLEASHALLCTLAEHGLPHVLLGFPRFARDADYAFRQLAPILSPHGVTAAEFAVAHAACVRLDFITDFGTSDG
jgi:hypothetical protein